MKFVCQQAYLAGLVLMLLPGSCRQAPPVPANPWADLVEHTRGRRFTRGLLDHLKLEPMGISTPTSTLNRYRDLWHLRKRMPKNADRILKLQFSAALELCGQRPAEAVVLLSRALEIDSDRASLHNDLAVAHLECARLEPAPAWALIKALKHARLALEQAPDRGGSHFNLGLVLERLRLYDQARLAWRESLSLLREPSLRREAAQHLSRLDRTLERERAAKPDPPVDSSKLAAFALSHRQFSRERVMHHWLPEWARLWSVGERAAASVLLERSRLVGTALAKGNGDPSVLATVRALSQAARTSVVALEPWAAGFTRMKQALDLEQNHQYQKAALLWRKAAADFPDEAGVIRAWIGWRLLRCDYFASRHLAVMAASRARDPPLSADYAALRAHVHWIEGLNLFMAGYSGLSLARYDLAHKHFQAAGERQNANFMGVLIAENLWALGQRDEGWQQYLKCLQKRPDMWLPKRRYTLLAVGADFLRKAEFHEEAVYFQEEVLAVAKHAGDPLLLQDAYLWRAKLHALRGYFQKAEADLAQASVHLDRIEDPPQRGRAQARIRQIKGGYLARQERWHEALEALSDALAYFLAIEDGRHLPDVFFDRAKTLIALKRLEEAEKDFAQGLIWLEQERANTPLADFRVSYLDRSRAFYKAKARFLALEKNDPWAAFLVAEEARARLLQDVWSARRVLDGPSRQVDRRANRAVKKTALGEGLPEATVIVTYLALEDQLFLWLVTASQRLFLKVPVSRDVLAASIEAWLAGLQKQEPLTHVQDHGLTLYRLLLEPVAERIELAGKHLVFVPDGPLHKIPFAALVLPDRHFLIERVSLSVSPSVWFYRQALARDRFLSHQNGSKTVLLAGNGGLDRHRYPFLDELPGVGRELEIIGAAYESNKPYKRVNPLSERWFLANWDQYEIVHFAGHALADAAFPARSKLLCQALEDDDGDLHLFELLAARENRKPGLTRLVLLSACSTLGTAHSESEGVLGMAHGFLSVGVPAVIASLWDIQDRPTQTLMASFHQHLAKGLDAAAALAQAQRAAIRMPSGRHGSHPAHWAAFQLHGASQ